jgi:hypothetical protein
MQRGAAVPGVILKINIDRELDRRSLRRVVSKITELLQHRWQQN